MNDRPGYFITGTDTGVGKTAVTLGLMQYLQSQGRTVAAMKPVASGCETTAAGLRNDDALKLQQQASVSLDYAQVNAYAFEPAIAPHIAAEQAGLRIDIDEILIKYKELRNISECVLVEGIGGWQVPLNAEETLADLARALGLGVILVVGIRLGCINHALLSVQSIQASGCELLGWVANQLPPASAAPEVLVSALDARLTCPRLGSIPYLPKLTARNVAACLSLGQHFNT